MRNWAMEFSSQNVAEEIKTREMPLDLKIEETVFLNLLKAGIWGMEVTFPEGMDNLHGVIRLAKSQSLLGIVGNEILKDRRLSALLPNELRLRLKSFKVSNILTYKNINEKTVQVCRILKDNGIPAVLLKGSGLALNYPIPELRQCGDIDLYVGEEHYLKAYDLMQGAADSLADAEEIWIDKNFSAMFGEIEVEIHRIAEEHPEASLDRKLQQFTRDYLRSAPVMIRLQDELIETPSDTFNALYVFFHLYRHFMIRGVGLRQVCDWMLFMRHRGCNVDTEALLKILEELDLMEPWQDFATLAVDLLGCPKQAMPFYRPDVRTARKMRILKRILVEGNFGKEALTSAGQSGIYLISKMRSMGRHLGRYSRLFVIYPLRLFPFLKRLFGIGFWRVGRDLKKKK